jgi:hypothetical protein
MQIQRTALGGTFGSSPGSNARTTSSGFAFGFFFGLGRSIKWGRNRNCNYYIRALRMVLLDVGVYTWRKRSKMVHES